MVFSRRQVRVLNLCQWPNSTFDPKVIEHRFPELRNLTVMDSKVTRLKEFSGELKELQVTLLLIRVMSGGQSMLQFYLKR
jgi:hypothetical protein